MGTVVTEFLLPDIGDGLTEAEVVRWLVPEGAQVDRDEPLVEVETDKAVVVIPSPVAGIVLRHGAGQGETMSVGTVLAVIAPPGEGNTHPSPPGRPGAAEPRPIHGPPASETREPTGGQGLQVVPSPCSAKGGFGRTAFPGPGPGSDTADPWTMHASMPPRRAPGRGTRRSLPDEDPPDAASPQTAEDPAPHL